MDAYCNVRDSICPSKMPNPESVKLLRKSYKKISSPIMKMINKIARAMKRKQAIMGKIIKAIIFIAYVLTNQLITVFEKLSFTIHIL